MLENEKQEMKRKSEEEKRKKEQDQGGGTRKTLLPVLREQKLMRSSIRSSGNQSIPAAPPFRFSGLETRQPPHPHPSDTTTTPTISPRLKSL